jgi:hypothetical protein
MTLRKSTGFVGLGATAEPICPPIRRCAPASVSISIRRISWRSW